MAKHKHKGCRTCRSSDPTRKEPLVLNESEESLVEYIMRVGEDAYEDQVIEAIRNAENGDGGT